MSQSIVVGSSTVFSTLLFYIFVLITAPYQLGFKDGLNHKTKPLNFLKTSSIKTGASLLSNTTGQLVSLYYGPWGISFVSAVPTPKGKTVT